MLTSLPWSVLLYIMAFSQSFQWRELECYILNNDQVAGAEIFPPLPNKQNWIWIWKLNDWSNSHVTHLRANTVHLGWWFLQRVLDPNLSNQRGFFSNRQHLASQPLLLFRVFYLGTSITPFFRPSTSKSVKKNNYGSPACLNSRSEAIHPQIKPWLSKRTCFFPLLACLCYEELSNKIKNSIY